MTNPTPHGQVPEALIDLIDAYAETRHRCGGIYNAKTEAARKAVIEALSGVQALSAAPAEQEEAAQRLRKTLDIDPGDVNDPLHPRYIAGFKSGHAAGRRRAAPAASPTPPAEQQAPKETLGGVNGWRDISTAPKDGSRFVATGHNYGLYSEVRHTCVAQWFQGCWMEASDWNETSELKYLTHWMPLPSPPDDVAAPAEQQAAPKAAPGDAIDEAMRQRDDAVDFIDTLLDEVLGHERPEWSNLYGRADALNDVQERITALHKPAVDKAWGQFQSAKAAPQQEAQEPAFVDVSLRTAIAKAVYQQVRVEFDYKLGSWTALDADEQQRIVDSIRGLYTAPQPAPESIRSILVRCREFIDTTKVPAYPAGADLADEIDVLLAHQPAPAPLSDDAKDAARYRYLRDGDWREHDKLESIIRLQLNSLWDAAIDAARKQGENHD